MLKNGRGSSTIDKTDYYKLKLGLLFGNLESINGLLKVLDAQNLAPADVPTPYSSIFMFILSKSGDKYTVKATFNKKSLVLGGKCENFDSCEIGDFVEYLESLADTQLVNAECGTEEKSVSSSNIKAMSLTGLGFAVIGLGYLFMPKRKQTPTEEENAPTEVML